MTAAVCAAVVIIGLPLLATLLLLGRACDPCADPPGSPHRRMTDRH